MKKLLLVICVFLTIKSWSQNYSQQDFSKSNKPTPTAAVRNSKPEKKYNTPATRINTSNINEKSSAGLSFLDEFARINDERLSIEKDNSLSNTEKQNKIQKNNLSYLKHKEVFNKHIESIGFNNASRDEQKQFVALLKEDNNMTEYKKYVELIKIK